MGYLRNTLSSVWDDEVVVVDAMTHCVAASLHSGREVCVANSLEVGRTVLSIKIVSMDVLVK